jgi:hypothetical protein
MTVRELAARLTIIGAECPPGTEISLLVNDSNGNELPARFRTEPIWEGGGTGPPFVALCVEVLQ